MERCMVATKAAGRITRFPGGFWCPGETFDRGNAFGATTIRALVDRKLLDYSSFKERHGMTGRFPVEAVPPPTPLHPRPAV